MRLVLALVATALAIAALWIATRPNGTNGFGQPRIPPRHQPPKAHRSWAVVYLLLATAFGLLAVFWPNLTD